jgi:hypothetical protein
LSTDDLNFATRLLDAQKQQHDERMVEARDLNSTVKDMSVALVGKIEKIEKDLTDKPGKAEVRTLMVFAGLMFAVMMIAFLKDHGVDTTSAVKDTKELVAP